MKMRNSRFGQAVAVLVIVSQFAVWAAAPAEAGVLSSIHWGIAKIGQGARAVVDTLNNVVNGGRKLAINTVATVGGIAFGLGGAVIGGLCAGPLGLIGGAVGGYFLGKLLIKGLFKTPLPTVAGAVIGGLLTASMGFPAVILGALIGAAAGHFIRTGNIGNSPVFRLAEQDRKAEAYIQYLQAQDKGSANSRPAVAAGAAQPAPALQLSRSQDLHDRYRQAYQKYVEATQKGDPAEAKKWLAEYQAAGKALKGAR